MTSTGLGIRGGFMGNGREIIYYQDYKFTCSRHLHLFFYKINFDYNTVATLQ